MKRFPWTFMLAATVPFVALSIAVSLHMFRDAALSLELLLTYAAVIISFLGGIHLGVAISQYHNSHKIANLLIAESIWPSLIAWGILFYADTHIQLLALTLLYTFMWAVDSLLYNNDVIPQWFYDLRCIITPIVVVSLYVAYFGLV